MGASLSVFKIINLDKNKFIKEEVSSLVQKSLADFPDLDLSSELGSAKSVLKFLTYDDKNNRVTYNAVHYSDTINRPVRVFLDEIEESLSEIRPTAEVIEKKAPSRRGTQILENGYQEVFTFDVIIDFNTSEIFIFTKKSIAHSFMSRFKKSRKLDYEHIYFDLSKIDELPELDNVWGVWEDSTGRCKRKAYFGTEVHKEDGISKANITSYNVEFEYGNDIRDLIIAKECRISSNSSLMTNADLFKIYLRLKEGLKKE
jgi:uncharacterized protein YerC